MLNLLAIKVSVNVLVLLGFLIFAFGTGYYYRSNYIRKYKKRIFELEKEMLRDNARILELEKEKLEIMRRQPYNS